MMTARRLLAVFSLLVSVGSAAAQDLLPPDRPIETAIDHYIDAKLNNAKIKPAPIARDANLARRLTLDLVGRIPTPAEVKDYLGSTDPSKRAKLIDRLMSSSEYVRHAATEFDALLAGDNDRAPSVRPYLLAALKENRPWDRMFRELIGVAAAANRPEQFVLGRLKETDDLTRDVSSVFFGLNITCAQCHRHPYVESISQDYFHGMKLFFSRSIDFNNQLLERQHALAEYKDKKGKVHKAKLIFLSGTVVEEPPAGVADLAKAVQDETKKLDELRKAFPKSKQLPAKPAFSYREQLANVALRPSERERFARALVNRLWHRFYGYGLVMRLDQMHSENPPSHPELLAWLARDFLEHNYDLNRLIRGLVSSAAYARSSRWEQPGNPPSPDYFAVAQLRPLTPMQYGFSQLMVSGAGIPAAGPAFDGQYESLEKDAMRHFGRFVERPRDGMQINASEALLLSNDVVALRMQAELLIPKLVKLKDPREQVEAAIWTVYSRPATEDELKLLGDYLAESEKTLPRQTPQQRNERQATRLLIEKARARVSQIDMEIAKLKAPKDKDRRDKLQAEQAELRKTADLPLPVVIPYDSPQAQALHQMVWALLNSPEFRFNY